MTKLEKLICQQMAEQRVHEKDGFFMCSDGDRYRVSEEFGKQMALWHEELLLTSKLKYKGGNAAVRRARALVDAAYYWLAADCNGVTYAYDIMPPHRGSCAWEASTNAVGTPSSYSAAAELRHVITWSDEPIDLRQWLLTQENLAGLHPHPLDKEAHQQ